MQELMKLCSRWLPRRETPADRGWRGWGWRNPVPPAPRRQLRLESYEAPQFDVVIRQGK
ncbi:MAG: hypothetical protein NTZ16_03380 [Verrucomicrobia bacterium]|nr:hypothetical protein [Verrucomicrobiota bacterium]